MTDRPISRRRFIQGTMATAAALSCSGRAMSAPSNEKPLLRFMQWNDTHVQAKEPNAYRRANARLEHVINALGKPDGYPMPDFIVGVGDLVHGGSLENLAPDLTRFKAITAKLKCPFYPVVGNHENVQREGDATYEAPFRQAFKIEKTNFTFKKGGLLFVMLNNSGAPPSNKQAVGRHRNAWFRRVLEESPDVPKIVCCHIPLVAMREEAVLKKSFGFVSYKAADDTLIELIKTHSDSIFAVLSGHLHLTGAVQRDGVWHIVPSGTASYPSDVAVHDLFPDRLRVRMFGMKKDLLDPTDIHGKPRHAIDYTDATHPTHETYVGGNPAERDFTISLDGKRRVAIPHSRRK
ncbi:MAG: metallophosphoesterase [Pirellulales bacterium]|nr:metallophosphoesterase [Pirellulales bacterium]